MEAVLSIGFGVWLVITGLMYKLLTGPRGGRKR